MSLAILIPLIGSAFALAALVWRYDLYDKEPWYMVLLAMALGAGMMSLMTPPQLFLLARLMDHLPYEVALPLVASSLEEVGKFLMVVLIALLIPKFFNDPMDGIIYGSLVGIGAAVEESIDFVGDHEGMLPPGELVRLLGHAVMGGISGMGVGLYVTRHRLRHVVLPACLVLAIVLHFLWNLIAVNQREPSLRDGVLGSAILICGCVVYGSLIIWSGKLAREHFRAEDHHRLWGWPFTSMRR